MGCISEYVSHCVSLWKGRIDSHAAVAYSLSLGVDGVDCGKGENVGDELEVEDMRCWGGGSWGIEEHGQASPSETPLMAVRDAGQMGASPDMRMFHNTGRMTTGVEEACVVGWARR
jgi:hypothetical protein